MTNITYKQNGTTVLGNLTYDYDKGGNRTRIGGIWARTGIPQAISTTAYNAANHQTTFGDKTMTFDNNGNLQTITDPTGITTYTWNARNQLAGISGPGVSASFVYDGLGRREKKTINGNLTEFLYDGLNPVQETSDANVLANILPGLGIDEFFIRTDIPAGNTSHFLPDVLGSAVALADSTGSVQTEYSYEPFGKMTASGTPNTNPIQYTGRESDGNGLYYYRNRYYHPVLSRFFSEDPIGLAARQWNLYGYVGNNPVNFADPTGLVVDVVVDIASIAYDVYRLSIDGRKNLDENLTSLGLDLAGTVIPGVTGLGAANRLRRMTPDQIALKDLVRQATHRGRTPLSVDDANTVLDWAKEINYPGWRALPDDVANPSNWHANPVPHIHLPGIARSTHIPVAEGVTPRP